MNKSTVNSSETEHVIFANRPYDHSITFLTLGNCEREAVDKCKFVGTIVVNELTFAHHMNHIFEKVQVYYIRKEIPPSPPPPQS